MGNDTGTKRQDDAFMRKVIWALILLSLSSAGAIGVMQVQISNNALAVKEAKGQSKTLNAINLTLQRLLDSGEHRNELLLTYSKKISELQALTMGIFGEQKARGPRITNLEKEINEIKRKIK